jgi:hypothetical protein
MFKFVENNNLFIDNGIKIFLRFSDIVSSSVV